MKTSNREAIAARLMQKAAVLFPLGIKKSQLNEPVAINPKHRLNPAKAMKP